MVLAVCNYGLHYEDVQGSGDITPYKLNLGTRWRSVVGYILWSLYPRTSLLVHTGQKTGWASEPI
jgi:hypothetical protein